jgi:hypothetical protein
MRHEIAMKKLVEYVARKASALSQKYALEDLVSPSIAPVLAKSIDRIASTIARKNGGLWCNLCEKGPFTKRGFYLHLIRVHARDIESMVQEEMRRITEALKR